jgi:hypothetical protein
MANVEIFNKEKGKWLNASQIDDLLYETLLPQEFEWEVSKENKKHRLKDVS